MAKLSAINKNNKRIKLSDKFYKKRESLKKIIIYVSQNKKKMFYDLQCKKDINSFIFKFDTFSMGIIFRETFKILNKYFGITIDNLLVDLIEKMTDLNFKTRLNIKQILKHKYFSK